ncbi:MAG: hypothetical protein C4293_06875 [Nitrospiraceae bacterium]
MFIRFSEDFRLSMMKRFHGCFIAVKANKAMNFQMCAGCVPAFAILLLELSAWVVMLRRMRARTVARPHEAASRKDGPSRRHDDADGDLCGH